MKNCKKKQVMKLKNKKFIIYIYISSIEYYKA